MPFPKSIREWVKRVQGNQCLAMEYTEKGGFQRCKGRVDQVHHLQPETWVLMGNEDFSDPNNGSVPIGICSKHHAKIHPDQAIALIQYRKGDKESFKKMAQHHHQAAAQGEVFWMNDVDLSMIQRARETQMRWVMEHPQDKKPIVKPHKLAGKRKKKWWELF